MVCGHNTYRMPHPINTDHFYNTLDQNAPPSDWGHGLKALWYDRKGDWHKAHDLVDGSSNGMAKWIHAYLHRKEGDEWNAGYWYRQAGKPFPEMDLDAEFQVLLAAVLG